METRTSQIVLPSANHHYHHHNRHHDRQLGRTQSLPPLQAFTDRLTHALLQPLLLLYRSDPEFYVLGATGNVYIINLSITPSCTCPDRTTPCKHILFVLIKVLGVPLDDPSLRRKTLNSSHLERLRASPSSPKSLASKSLCQRFHHVFFLEKELGIHGANLKPCLEVDRGATCPICLEEIGKSGDRMVACETCRIPIHEECLMNWKRIQRNRLTKCVTCSSPWRKKGGQQRYLNLADYVSEDEITCPKTGGNNSAFRYDRSI